MDPQTGTSRRRVATSLDELVGTATGRQPMKGADSLSGAAFERLVIDGEPFVLKYLHVDDDWVMRATGDVTCRPVVMWTSGLYDDLPPFIDHTVVGVATGLGRNGWGAAVLMRDVGDRFVADDASAITLEQHERLIEHMARFHAHGWGWQDTVGLAPFSNYVLFFNQHLGPIEAALDSGAHVPSLVDGGYEQMARISPRAHALVMGILHDPNALLVALDATPHTFIHGDFKLGNLGSHPDGRTILVDWAYPSEGPALCDLAWYLGTNAGRFPQSREACIDHYRRSLATAGIPAEGWFDRQLSLALLGTFLLQGWSKTFDGRDEEFDWWEERALDAEQHLA